MAQHKRIRPKPYVHILFKPAGKAPRWYWAIKLCGGHYQRCLKDGGLEVATVVRKDGTTVVRTELLIGESLKERRAVMNLHYAELEEE